MFAPHFRSLSPADLTLYLITAEKLLRTTGAVNPHIWQDSPLSFKCPRIAAYAAVRLIFSPSFTADIVNIEFSVLLHHAFYTMRRSLGEDGAVKYEPYMFVKAEPVTDDEMLIAAQIYVERLDYWPKKTCTVAQLRERGLLPPPAKPLPLAQVKVKVEAV
jgi:hypothetical protein